MLLALFLVFLLLVSLLFLLFLFFSSLGQLLHKLVKLLTIGPVEGGRVSAAGSPALVNVLVPDEALNLMRTCVLARFLVVAGQIRLPESVHDHVIHVFVHLDKLWLPPVEVNRLDLRNVSPQVSVLAGAPQTNEGAKSGRGPPWSLGETVRAVLVGTCFQHGFQDLDLLTVKECLVT